MSMTETEIRSKYGEKGLQEYRRRKAEGESDDFIMSMLVGYLTDDALIGAMAGGSLAGGIVGDMMNDSDSDSGSSYDSGSSDSSYDSGGSDSSD